MIFLKGTTFNVDAMPGASSVQASNIDGEKGTFNVKISDILAPAGVSKVEVPIWCAGDQSDIKWYTANKKLRWHIFCRCRGEKIIKITLARIRYMPM